MMHNLWGTHLILYIRGQQTSKDGLNPTMPTPFTIVYSCLHATMVEVSSCDRNCRGLREENIYYLTLNRKSLPPLLCMLFLPEGRISLGDSLCEGLNTGYLPSCFGLLQKDVPYGYVDCS